MTLLGIHATELADFYAGVTAAGKNVRDYHVSSEDPVIETDDIHVTRGFVTVENIVTGDSMTYSPLTWCAAAVLDVEAGRL